MPRALTPAEHAERAMKRRAARKEAEKPQAKGDSGEKKDFSGEKKPVAGRDYKIRYGKIHPERLSQWAIVWQHPGYSRPPAPQPNNGEHGAKQITPPLDFRTKRAFYNNLIRSVGAEGVRNPIFCLAYPDGTFVRYGCSRVWAARQQGLTLPAVIADYTGVWNHLEELHNEQEIRSKYVDQPSIVELHEDWMRIDGCP